MEEHRVDVGAVLLRLPRGGEEVFSESRQEPGRVPVKSDRARSAMFRQPGIAGWSADGKQIYFSEPKGTGTLVYRLDLAGNRIDELKTTPSVLGAMSLNRSGTTLGFVRQTSDTPPDVFVATVSETMMQMAANKTAAADESGYQSLFPNPPDRRRRDP